MQTNYAIQIETSFADFWPLPVDQQLFVVDARGIMALLELSDVEKEDDSHLHSIHAGEVDFTRGYF